MIVSSDKFSGGGIVTLAESASSIDSKVQQSKRDRWLARQDIELPENASLLERGLIGAQRVAEHVPQNIGFMLGEALAGPLGAGAGTAAGEALVQGAQIIGKQREGFEPKKIAEEGVIGAIIPPAFKAGGTILKAGAERIAKPFIEKIGAPLARIAKAGLQGIRRVFPGISQQTKEMISKYPTEVEALATQKSVPINPILAKLEQARDFIFEKANKELNAAKEAFAGTGEQFVYDTNAVVRGVNKALQETENASIKNLQFGKEGLTKFGGGALGIGSKEKRILDKVINVVKDSKVNSLDDLVALKSTMRDEAKSLFPKPGEQASKAVAVFQNIIAQLDEFVPASIKEANKIYSGRRELMEQIQGLIPEMKTGLMSPSAIRKVEKLGNEEVRTIYGDLLENIKKETRVDIGHDIDVLFAAREVNPNLIVEDVSGAPIMIPGVSGIPGRVTSGMQKMSNPILGRIKIEMAKGNLGIPIIREVKEGLKAGTITAGDILSLFKQTLEPGAKVAAYDLISSLLSEENATEPTTPERNIPGQGGRYAGVRE